MGKTLEISTAFCALAEGNDLRTVLRPFSDGGHSDEACRKSRRSERREGCPNSVVVDVKNLIVRDATRRRYGLIDGAGAARTAWAVVERA